MSATKVRLAEGEGETLAERLGESDCEIDALALRLGESDAEDDGDRDGDELGE
jgi:hypothetical protein